MKKIEKEFEQIGSLIEHNRTVTVGAVNCAGLFTYWQVGGFVSGKLQRGEWGSKVVDELVDFLKTRHPGLKGYGRRHIYNMVKFYETYHSADYAAVSERLRLDEFVQSPIAQLKAVGFEPEFVGKMDLYLAALDREIKRPNENPSVGIILCPKADEVDVAYTLDRTMSPMMVAEYRRQLVPENVLRRSLEEYCTFWKREAKA